MSFFTKAVNALRFGSSQPNDSMNGDDTYDTPSKPSKKRKSLEGGGGSGKKKHKKHQHTSDQEQEFKGFSDSDRNAEKQEDVTSPGLNHNEFGVEEDVRGSADESKQSAKKRKSKKLKSRDNNIEEENSVSFADPGPEPASSDIPQGTPITVNQNEGIVESRSAKKKRRRRERKSLELARGLNGTNPQELEQPTEGLEEDAVPVSSVFGEVVNKKKKKKSKRPVQSSPPLDVDVGDNLVQEQLPEDFGGSTLGSLVFDKETSRPFENSGLSINSNDVDTLVDKVELRADSAASIFDRFKKSPKKNKRPSLSQETEIQADSVNTELEAITNDGADTVNHGAKDEGHEKFTESMPISDPKRKHSKKNKSKDQADLKLATDPPEASQEHRAKSVKAKKSRKHRSSNGEASHALAVDSRDRHVDKNEAAIHGDASGTHQNGNSRGLLGGQLDDSSNQANLDSAEHDEEILEIVPVSADIPALARSKKSKKSKNKAPANENSDALLEASSQTKKSKSRDRENAFKESFKHRGNIESSDIENQDSSLEVPASQAPSSSRQAITSNTDRPSQSIGIYDTNGKNMGKSGKARKPSAENLDAERLDSDLWREDRVHGGSVEAPVNEEPPTSLKRKRGTKQDESDTNPEALRLPARKRRAQKSATRSSPVNPEALRLPEKKGTKKSRVAANKSSGSTSGADASNAALKKTGPFSEEEIEEIKGVLDAFADANDLSEPGVKQVLQANARKNEQTARLLQEIYAALPHRASEALVKVARRKFHNFERYGRWTSEEDEELKKAVEKHGSKWTKVAVELERHPEDVRDRWRNYGVCGEKLDRGPWTKKEEDMMMKKVEERINNLREAWGDKAYEHQLKKGRTEYELIDWILISEDMGLKRSRLQCQAKYKNIKDRTAPGPSWTGKEDPETNSWRTMKGRAEQHFMKPGDKYLLLRSIQRAGYGREEKIQFGKLGDKALQENFSLKGKKLFMKFTRRDMPGEEDMTLQELVSKAIEDLVNKYPDRLGERYNPEVDGEAYPTRSKRSKSSSAQRVTGSDDEDSDASSGEDNPTPKRTPKLRDRMKRKDESSSVDEAPAQKSRKAKSQIRSTKGKETKNDDVDSDHDVEMADGRDAPVRSQPEPEIEDSEDENHAPKSNRHTRQSQEEISEEDEEDEDEAENEEESDGAGSIDLSLPPTNQQSEEDAEESDAENVRGDSIASDRGREFRLAGTNLEDVEISSDDSFEDIPAVRPSSERKGGGTLRRDISSSDEVEESD